MEKILEFFSNNSAIVSVIVLIAGILVGRFLPVSMFKKFGKEIDEKFDLNDDILKMFNERIDAFQEGLTSSEEATSNEQIKEATDKLKTDISKLGK